MTIRSSEVIEPSWSREAVIAVMGVHPSMSIVGAARRERDISGDCPDAT